MATALYVVIFYIKFFPYVERCDIKYLVFSVNVFPNARRINSFEIQYAQYSISNAKRFDRQIPLERLLFPFLEQPARYPPQRAINQSADILVPVPNLRTGIQGSSDVCDPSVGARILLSKPVSIRIRSFGFLSLGIM